MNTPDNWRKTLLPIGATLREAIGSLNESGLQIAIVVNQDDILEGTITDGDIRRGLLKGLTLDSSIADIVFRDNIVVPPDMERQMVLGMMRANKVTQIPVVDDTGRVVGLHVWDEVLRPVKRTNLMVIMAGGRGVRLRPHTENCPKPLLPIGGRPMLETIIDKARQEGFKQFLLAVHYLGHMIEKHFEDGRRWQVRINYLREPAPLGTAGA